MKSKYRIKSKTRFCMFFIVLFFMVITITGNLAGHNHAIAMSKPAYTEIMVVSGDTLWNLAKDYGPENQDIRKVIHRICAVNDISADRLATGQKILIPKYL